MGLLISFLICSILNFQIITEFNTHDKLVALTFDACETKTPSYFDKGILNYVIDEKLPVTFFLSGKFIERNLEEIEKISKYDFIEIENHSYLHADFTKLSGIEIKEDVLKNEQLITNATGRKPLYFRFPYGYYNQDCVHIIEKLGYKIVHWTFPSGDPDKGISREMLIENTLNKIKPGAILIFHINGRGWKTKEALPVIVNRLKQSRYKFVLLREILK